MTTSAYAADDSVLDNPVWAALTGPHAALGQREGDAARYDPDVTPFAAVAPGAGARAWHDLATLAGPGALALLTGDFDPPAHWEVTMRLPGVQLVDTTGIGRDEPEAVLLTGADVPEMLDLVERTKPGPFRKRTIAMGSYLGLRHEGTLVAMAGERMRLPGWTEISAVCTDPGFRGRGLANRLVRAVAANIARRGDTPFLHAAIDNPGAIRLYEVMGFTTRRVTDFAMLRVPSGS